MVFVFGLDMPVWELMLIFVVFLTAGFVVLLVELRKLQKIIMQERYDVTRFEQDLALLEAHGEHKGKEPSGALQEYVRKALAKGLLESDIRLKLQARGWQSAQIDKVLKSSTPAKSEKESS